MPKLIKKNITNKIKFYNKRGDLYILKLKNESKMIGEYLSMNNIRFEGEWIKGKYNNKNVFIQNKGRWLWPNGDWFSGFFKNGYHSDGCGKKSCVDGSSFYGIWKDGLPYSGRIVYRNGNWFEGFIFKNKPYNGHGFLKLNDKVFFAGTFKNGYLYDGQCKYYSDDKTYYFEGHLKKGKMWEGKKTIVDSDQVFYIKNGKEYSGLDILSEVAINLKN